MSQPKKSVAVATPAPERSLLVRIAQRYHVEPEKMSATLKATAFRNSKAEITNEQLMMLLVVADQYKLNPFTAEIFAFPSSERGVVPIVSVDGWIRILNERPELQSIAFEYSDDDVPVEESWCKCTIWRKDRDQPIVVKEYMRECRRNTGPWNSHPCRMLRHKALIQCGRIAFGFGGIYDADEGERIIDATATVSPKAGTMAPRAIEAPKQAEDTPQAVPEQAAAQVVVTPMDSRTVEGLRARLEEFGVPESKLLAAFEVGELSHIGFERFADAYAVIPQIASDQ